MTLRSAVRPEARVRRGPCAPAGGPGLARLAQADEAERDPLEAKRPSGFSVGGEGRDRGRRWECSGRRATRGGSSCACSRRTRARASAFSTGSDARPPGPRGRACSARPTPTSWPSPTASPRPTRRSCARRGPQAVVVDLSGDLRLPDAAAYKEWYGHDHPEPGLLARRPLRPARGLSRRAPRRAPRLEPRLLRDLGAAAPRAPPAREARGRRRRRGRRQERRHRGRPHPARGPPLLRGRRATSRPTPRAAPTGTWARWRPCSRRPRGATVRLTFCPHLLPVKRGILSALYLRTIGPRSASGPGRRSCRRPSAASTPARPSCRSWRRPRALRDVAFTNDCRISVHAAGAGPGGGVLGPRQPREGRGRPGRAEPEPGHGLGRDGRVCR